MEYVELLRVRRGLIAYLVALVFCFAVVSLVLHGHGGIHINMSFGKDGVSIGDLLQLGGVAALFLATGFAANLAAEGATLPFLWTKPITRTALALRFVAVDALGIAAGIVACALVAAIVVAGIGGVRAIHPNAALASDAALALGAPLAWYGITLLLGARLGRDAASRAGALVWPVFILLELLAVAALPPAGHALAVALEHVDPLAYLLGSEHADTGLLHLGTGPRAAACWAIAALTIPAAIRLWSLREA
jgi:hypothetical protein